MGAVTTVLDLSQELNIPVPAVIRCLLDFGRMRTVTQKLEPDEITLVRDNVEALRSRDFVRGRRSPPPTNGDGPDNPGVREPRGPRPSQGSAGATPAFAPEETSTHAPPRSGVTGERWRIEAR